MLDVYLSLDKKKLIIHGYETSTSPNTTIWTLYKNNSNSWTLVSKNYINGQDGNIAVNFETDTIHIFKFNKIEELKLSPISGLPPTIQPNQTVTLTEGDYT